MKKITAKILLTITTLGILGLSTAYATNYQPPKIPKPHTLVGPSSDARNVLTTDILPRLVVGLIGMVGAMSLLFLIIGGVRFAMVYGNEESAQTAKKQVIYSLVGLVLALLSYTIVNIVSSLKFEGDTTEEPKPSTATSESATPSGKSETKPTPEPEPKAEPSTPPKPEPIPEPESEPIPLPADFPKTEF